MGAEGGQGTGRALGGKARKQRANEKRLHRTKIFLAFYADTYHIALMHTASLHFATVCGNTIVSTVTVHNVNDLEHAVAIGHGLVGGQSIAKSLALYLSNVELDNNDFECLCAPSFWQAGTSLDASAKRDDSLTPRIDPREGYGSLDQQDARMAHYVLTGGE